MTDRPFDLAVVGAGILGLAHAYIAARAGLRVVVLERDLWADGASIRNFGFVTVTGQERGESWGLARRTRDHWARLAQDAGIPVLQRGLLVPVRSAEALAVLEAFLGTEMGADCRLLSPEAFRRAAGVPGGEGLQGALQSPHELRVESRTAVPALAAHLAARHGVEVRTGTAVLARTRAGLATSQGPVAAARVVVCPGTDFATLYPETIAPLALRKCRLSMLRLADPGLRLGAPLMSDLGLIRYRGYAALPEAEALRSRLGAEYPRALANGVHLIVVQGQDGSLVVGDSHHTSAQPDPFAPAEAEAEILAEFARASGLAPPPVLERWTGVYAVSAAHTYVVAAPEPDVRLALVTSGTGASTAFAIAEAVLLDLCGLPLGDIP